MLKNNSISYNKRGKNNPSWKGKKVGYSAIHQYIRYRKKKPKLCTNCFKVPPRDLANISGKYLRKLSDYEYICRRCHMEKDGRSQQLRLNGKSRKLPDKECLNCIKVFHSEDRKAKYCSKACSHIAMWKKRPRRKNKNCKICLKEFFPKLLIIKTCSRTCGIKLSWKTRKNTI